MICNILMSLVLGLAVATENMGRIQENPSRFARRQIANAGGYGAPGVGLTSAYGANQAGYVANGNVAAVGGSPYPVGAATSTTSSSTTTTTSSSTNFGFQQIYGTYQSLLLQVQQCQTALAAGGISAQVATQYLSQLAYQFQSLLSPYGTCGACGIAPASISSFGGIVQQIVASFQQLLVTCQNIFPNAWTSILGSAWTPLNYAFPILLNMVQSAGLSVSTYFSSSFMSYFHQIGSLSGVLSAFNRFGL